MKLIEALQIVNRPADPAQGRFRLRLACGFTPLHLEVLLRAHLRLRAGNRAVATEYGLYGDLAGNVEALAAAAPDGAAVIVEWSDIEPRLGLRQLGGWSPGRLGEMVEDAQARLDRIANGLAGAGVPVALVLPTLDPAPAGFTAVSEAGQFDLALGELVARFAVRAAALAHVTVVSPAELDRLSPSSSRHDVAAELATGFPYSIPHADAMASLASRALLPPEPKKGLITDLDDTLWLGILGEDGIDGISWDVDHRSQMHGVYQQFLQSLAEAGTLLAVASKNDPALVEEAFRRRKPHLDRAVLYPVEAHWEPKPVSVERILKTWNVGADSVVFVDDSPTELDQVAQAFPGVECLRFPKGDPAGIAGLIRRLRELFGKRSIRSEDRIRSASIRETGELRRAAEQGGGALEGFLRNAEARLAVEWGNPLDPRILQLINKTNQFNLNGRRFTETEWRGWVETGGAAVLAVNYSDKYGPLGRIAVLAGRVEGDAFHVGVWVMSCRAFARRVEHATLAEVFERFRMERIVFQYRQTERNGPLRNFLAAAGIRLDGPVEMSRSAFEAGCPALYHQREEEAQAHAV